MAEFKADCLVCGKQLIYFESSSPVKCVYCGQALQSNVTCRDGHFICNTCHSLSANDFIAGFCIQSQLDNPVEMALLLMRDSRVKMHGPEHHFLVPAVLLASYYNAIEKPEAKAEKIRQAKIRAKNVLGGFCGFYGTCGAGMGAGMFISLVTGADPLSKSEWRLANIMTARSLKTIAEHGGPRCCKRDSFLAIAEATEFTRENLGVAMPIYGDTECEFSHLNHECTLGNCPFYYK